MSAKVQIERQGQYGDMLAVEPSGTNRSGHAMWLVRCRFMWLRAQGCEARQQPSRIRDANLQVMAGDAAALYKPETEILLPLRRPRHLRV